MKLKGLFVLFLMTSPAFVLSRQTHDHAAMAAGDGQFNPFAIADGAKGFYVSYVERHDGKNNLFVQHVDQAGVSRKPVLVNDRLGDAAVRNENPPKLALGPQGALYVVWVNEMERWKGNVLFSRSTDGGRTFSRSVILNTGEKAPPVGRAFQTIAVDSGGRIYVAWIDERNKTPRSAEVWMTASADGGRTFQPDRRILADVCECCRLTLLVQKDGRLLLSYRVVPAAGQMLRDIAVARSDDAGRTFQSAVVSHDGWDINACPIAGPAMALDGAGKLTIVWFTEIKGIAGLYYSTSHDGARTFSPRQTLTPDQKLARHANLAAGPDGSVFVAWDDVDSKTLVRWGELDTATHILKRRGSFPGSSYPIISLSGSRIAIVALQAESMKIFERYLPLS